MSAATSLLLAQQHTDDRGLIVAETFGPTFQGEGGSSGRQALFIRLSRCNLSCGSAPGSGWQCDTPYTWDFQRYDPRDPQVARRASVTALTDWALSFPTPLVVLTGGEPLLQPAGLERLVAALHTAGRRVEIETNGTLIPSADLIETVSTFNVSPKLAAAGDREARRIVPAALRAFAACGKARFKFVVSALEECKEVAELVERFALEDVWVMPEGTTAESVLAGMRDIADEALARGWNLSSRLHVLLWGDERGR